MKLQQVLDKFSIKLSSKKRKEVERKLRRDNIIGLTAILATILATTSGYKHQQNKYRITPPETGIEHHLKQQDKIKESNRQIRLRELGYDQNEPFEKRVERMINRHRGSISYRFMDALIHTESDYRPNANSHLGASYGRGLCQVSEILMRDYNRVHKKHIEPEDLYDPEINIKIAVWYLNTIPRLIRSNDPYDIYMAYNVGVSEFNRNKKYYREDKKPDGSRYGSRIRFHRFFNE